MLVNIKEFVDFKGRAFLLQWGGSIGSRTVVDALVRFGGDGRSARGVDLDESSVFDIVGDMKLFRDCLVGKKDFYLIFDQVESSSLIGYGAGFILIPGYPKNTRNPDEIWVSIPPVLYFWVIPIESSGYVRNAQWGSLLDQAYNYWFLLIKVLVV